jgi:hypothetical protein
MTARAVAFPAWVDQFVDGLRPLVHEHGSELYVREVGADVFEVGAARHGRLVCLSCGTPLSGELVGTTELGGDHQTGTLLPRFCQGCVPPERLIEDRS